MDTKVLESKKEDLERDLKRLSEIKANSTHLGFVTIENAIEDEIRERQFYLEQIEYELKNKK